MRTLIVACATLLACSAFASELYIIPAFANRVWNATTSWRSEVFVTNPHPHPVDLALLVELGEVDPFGCRFPEFSIPFPTRLEPRETRRICMPFRTSGAFAFQASDTLIVTSEMTAGRMRTNLGTRQPVEPGRRWIEAGERALIANVRNGRDARANLIVMNPGHEPITVRYSAVRVASYAAVDHDYVPAEGSVEVAARSLSITPLPQAPEHDCHGVVPCGNAIEHDVVVEGTGFFYAATSSVENDLDATFRSPHLIP